MQNVLLVEDEPIIAQGLMKYLKKYFFQVRGAYTYEEGLSFALQDMPDIICVDINLGSQKTGLDLCYEIRKVKPDLPLLIITGGDIEMYLEPSLRIQLTDYISKPYHPAEVRVRLEHLIELRKTFVPPMHQVEQYITPDFQLCHSSSTVVINGEKRHLPKTLKHLLELFLEHKNQILSHEFLQEKIWGDYYTGEKKREIRAHTKRLRQILGEKYGSALKNIKSQGYIFYLPLS